jgi:tetratricopeptide (TPR) repeat protein/TolB-like protein
VGTGDDSDDLDADSVLRALAAAPPVKPPPRAVTAMVIHLGAAANADDQLASIRRLVEKQDAKLDKRSDGSIAVMWGDATHAAGAALEIRDALPETRIALASTMVDATDTKAAERVVERALAILAAGSERVGIDEETAKAVENRFEIESGDQGIVLVEPMASGTPALVDKVIGNYKIVSLLGTGGMGVVYLAEHVSLGRKAVIKFVQERLTKDAAYTQRFFTEAKTAASIRHPGIVDVFDYGKDENGRGYIVMELLEGESLRTRLRREKPLEMGLAIALAAQMANAVAAAHEAGVIHRDLKPDNLFIVPDKESANGLRAKVLDFGLAKVTTDQAPGLTQSGNFVGTPLYMSPEQCRAKADIDHRTDVYSLGCILYEMVTGRPPFTDKTVGDLIIAHNTLPPTPPSELVETVTPALERAILKALAKHPDERFATMEAFATTLATLQPSKAPTARAGVATPLARPRGVSAPPPLTDGAKHAPVASTIAAAQAPTSRRKTLAIAAAALGIIALAIGGWLAFRNRGDDHRAVSSTRRSGKPTIAVLDLTSASPNAAWLGTAVGEVVRGDLQALKELHVMTADEVARVRTDLAIGDDAELSPDVLAKMRSDLGAEYVVTGRVTPGDPVRVEARLYETSSGTSRARFEELGQESDIAGVGRRLSASLERELGISVEDAPVTVTVLPSRPAAAKLYSEGLGKLRRLDLIEARDLFVRAADEQPDDPLIHSALANVWQQLGYQAKQRSEAKLAFDFRESLPAENQLAIEAQYREANAQWDLAIKAYKDLFANNKSHIEYGLSLAAAQTHSGDAKSAYSTLSSLRTLPHPLGSDPRIDLAEAAAAEEADDMERMRMYAEKAALMAAKRGARLLRAKALLKQGWALWTQGRDEDVAPIYAEAKELFSELGDRAGLARTLNNIGLAQHRQHRIDEAGRSYSDGLRIAEEIGDTEAQAWLLNNWAYLHFDAGDLGKALELHMKKLQLGGERGDLPSSQAAGHTNVSEILRLRGDLAGAREHCNQAEDLLRGLDARRYASFTAGYCGELLRVSDDLPGAKKKLEQALGWASDVMTPAESAEMRVAMARAELDDNRPEEAEKLTRAAISDLEAVNEGSQRVCASAILATALLTRGKVADAAAQLETTAKLPTEGVSFPCRIEADIARARVDVARDPATKPDVLARLEKTRAAAAAGTFVQWELSTRLAIGEISGDRAALKKLAKDADAIGFKLVGRRAKTLAR